MARSKTKSRAKIDAWIALASALAAYGKVPTGEGQHGTGSPQNVIENLLIEQLAHTPAHRDLLAAAIKVSSPRCLAALLNSHGAAAYQRHTDHVTTASLKQLEILHAAGIDLKPQEKPLLAHAFHAGSQERLRYLRTKVGLTGLLIDAVGADVAITSCPKSLLPDVAAELRADIATAGSSVSRKYSSPFTKKSLKYVALALLCGRSATPLFQHLPKDKISPKLRDLIKMSDSAHGRLKLASLEQSFERVLGRSNTSDFFGLSPDEAFESKPKPSKMPPSILDIISEWSVRAYEWDS